MSTAAVESSATEITRAAKSNLAFAFFMLSPERRQDISVFYAFCRLIDDLADDPGFTPAERAAGLNTWRRAVEAPVENEPPLAAEVRRLRAKYQLGTEHFWEIIAGCEMDLAAQRYETWEDLRLYCYRVASAVGLVSIEIFGYRDPRCREYAVELGLALQITNIIRDVGEDFRNEGRLYLPREEMERFGVKAEDLAATHETPELRRLLAFQAERAREHYRRAVALLPKKERRSMLAAEIMQEVYARLLRKMERRHWAVLQKRIRLPLWEKLWCVVRALTKNALP